MALYFGCTKFPVKLLVDETDWRCNQWRAVVLAFYDRFGGVVGLTCASANLDLDFVADGVDEDEFAYFERECEKGWFDLILGLHAATGVDPRRRGLWIL